MYYNLHFLLSVSCRLILFYLRHILKKWKFSNTLKITKFGNPKKRHLESKLRHKIFAKWIIFAWIARLLVHIFFVFTFLQSHFDEINGIWMELNCDSLQRFFPLYTFMLIYFNFSTNTRAVRVCRWENKRDTKLILKQFSVK